MLLSGKRKESGVLRAAGRNNTRRIAAVQSSDIRSEVVRFQRDALGSAGDAYRERAPLAGLQRRSVGLQRQSEECHAHRAGSGFVAGDGKFGCPGVEIGGWKN